ncbi:peptidoglycan DD-metalloendopeptidase family protein [Baaleninema simplex]|uniref:peptidoglycan DD-metalloendopeptidase family protein n=1 Tax=Baaleninema simplex TaxID=2862350 RepID=UPI0003485EC0|nr:peptidoglycan DD-metalloendopeptidase family protein [Baaleninema simplex]
MPESYRRVRTSAAAIGIALSMGASGVLLPKQGDAAFAAEPATAKTAATLMPPSVDKTAVLPLDKVPASETAAKAAPALDSRPEPTASESVAHLVQSGQTLWQIAKAYRVEANLIASANGISIDTVLEIGQILEIPVTEGMVYPPMEILAPESETVAILSEEEETTKGLDKTGKISIESSLSALPSSDRASKYELARIERNGDTPAFDRLALAKKPRTSDRLSSDTLAAVELSEELETANSQPLETAEIEIEPAETTSYQIAEGETLVEVASTHGVTVEDLARANHLDDPDRIVAGQEIAIPTVNESPARPLTVFGHETTLAALPDKKSRLLPDGDEVELSALPNVVLPNSPTGETDVPQLLSSTSADEVETAEVPVLGAATETPVETSELQAFHLSDDNSPYTNGLQADIERLRDRYGDLDDDTPAASSNAESSRTALVSPDRISAHESDRPSSRAAAPRVNPEFDPDRYNTVETGETESAERVKPRNDAQDVAVAPMGSDSYAPILPPRAVSPDLPALSAPGAYLPKPQAPEGGAGSGNMDFNGYIWPAQGVLSSGFGWRWGRMHNGIDIAGPIGTPIVAAAPGVVTYAQWNSGGYGNLVEITHPDGSLTLYAHNNRLLVNEGQQVAQGQQIAEMGNTGFSTGPHLHFEVHPAGQGAVNPLAYLP